ncbi:hypothetical protein DL762_010541 [Monosporascus cannonballus]|uniref:MPN domain-containing protein n=1 Tax=Monosporascus cannonballus TaxID=155416 RepID=A0ABY0GV31_9PEZI|nr:hypothetical protein DL762_010541 [Monosporascus cannonballus]
MDSTPGLPNRPLTVKEISDRAQAFELNTNIPLKAWLRTAHTLNNEGDIYLRERNFAQAYLLYFRCSVLLAERLRKHPEFKTAEGRKAARVPLQNLQAVLSNLEKIKPFIEREYQKWEVDEERRKERRGQRSTEWTDPKPLPPYEQHASRDPALVSRATLLDASENQELAVELAQEEIRRRDADKRAIRQAGISPEEEQTRRIAGFWDDWTADLAATQADDEDVFRRRMELTRRRLDRSDDYPSNEVRVREDHKPSTAPIDGRSRSYHYPSISKSQPVRYDPQKPSERTDPPSRPPRPPKEFLPEPYEAESGRQHTQLPPELPAKEQAGPDRTSLTPEPSRDLPKLPPKVRETPTPSAPAKEKQRRVTFKPAAYLENGEPLRSIFLPATLRGQFLKIAADNTRRGLEMCGMLCGTTVNNALFISKLVIPEQTCTSDTCETENETSLLDYCIENDLLILGWIHTHPTQTCFMSSRDLHTQASYQVMLKESIAIVCAPRFEPSYGIFRLTNPPGLDHVLQCTQRATFHQHSIDNLYTAAGKPPGHVHETEKLAFEVQDLRPGFQYNNSTKSSSAVPRKNF